jgi:hypothetical protein
MRRAIDCFWLAILAAGAAASLISGGASRGLPQVSLPGSWRDGLIDSAGFRASMQRLPVVSAARHWGHSLRVALGSRIPFIVVEPGNPSSYFVGTELPLMAGMDTGNSNLVMKTVEKVSQVDRLLASEGWSLIMVPVPPKLSIERDFVRWPLRYASSLAAPMVSIDHDRSIEVSRAFASGLQSRGIAVVDLHTIFLNAVTATPGARLFPPGESHWNELGIWIAARETASMIRGSLGRTERAGSAVLRRERVGADLAQAFDLAPAWLSRLSPVYWFDYLIVERMNWNDAEIPAERAKLGIVVVGTSYSGQYTWIANATASFPSLVGEWAGAGVTVNAAHAGRGSYFSMQRFLDNPGEIAGVQDAERAERRFVVWEFPLRDMQSISDQLEVRAGGADRQPAPATR